MASGGGHSDRRIGEVGRAFAPERERERERETIGGLPEWPCSEERRIETLQNLRKAASKASKLLCLSEDADKMMSCEAHEPENDSATKR